MRVVCDREREGVRRRPVHGWSRAEGYAPGRQPSVQFPIGRQIITCTSKLVRIFYGNARRRTPVRQCKWRRPRRRRPGRTGKTCPNICLRFAVRRFSKTACDRRTGTAGPDGELRTACPPASARNGTLFEVGPVRQGHGGAPGALQNTNPKRKRGNGLLPARCSLVLRVGVAQRNRRPIPRHPTCRRLLKGYWGRNSSMIAAPSSRIPNC
jgi:hypothetical protein